MKYIRAKQFIPNIHYIWCNESGSILSDQSTPPNGEIVDNVPNDEIMKDVRSYRNELLRLSDWTQLEDAPISSSKKLQWKAYRQELRDFPSLIDEENWTGPFWPVPPS